MTLPKMKGVNVMDFAVTIIIIIVVFAIAFAFWKTYFDTKARVAGPKAVDVVFGSVLLYSFAERKKILEKILPKKGIVVTTSLLTIIIFVVIVTFFLIMIYLSLTAEAGSASSSFFYGIFDAILRNLPWVK